MKQTVVDEIAANDMIRASELYRRGDLDLAIMLVDKSIMRALTVLLKQHELFQKIQNISMLIN